MANFQVMADVPNPVFDLNGDPFSGAVLKAFAAGTTTPISISTDENGGNPQASITYNAQGKLEVSGNEVLPYIDQKQKWGIFANATDAAANTPFYMGPFDDVPSFSESLVSITKKPIESITLIDGQTTVTFSTINASKADISLTALSGDGRPLLVGTDYTVTSSTVIELTNSYPAGTICFADETAVEVATFSDSDLVKHFDTLALAIAETTLEAGDKLRIEDRTIANNNSGGAWRAVLLTSVTVSVGEPTIGNIVTCTGNPLLALVLDVGMVINYNQWGALGNADTLNTDDSAAINQAHAFGSSSWEVYQGTGIFACADVLPKQKQVIRNTRFKHVGNGGSTSPINGSAVLRLGDGLVNFEGFLLDNVHVNGNRAAFANIDILGGADGGMHGLHIHGKVSNGTVRDSSFTFCGTAGVALDWPGTKPPSTDAPDHSIHDINFVRVDFNDNREHGTFAAYCQRIRYLDCNYLRNGIDLAGGPFAEEDGRHGAFILANGYFSRGIDIEGYHSQSGFTKVEIIGGESSGNANGAVQFFDVTTLAGNRVGANHCQISNLLCGPVTVGTAASTISVEMNNPLGTKYGINNLYMLNNSIQGPVRINGVKGLTITGHQTATVDPVESIEIFNSEDINTDVTTTSEMEIQHIDQPVLTIDVGTSNVPTISNTKFDQPVGGVSRVTYKIFVTGASVADEDLKIRATFANSLPLYQARDPKITVAAVSEVGLNAARLVANAYTLGVDPQDEVYCVMVSPADNFNFYLTVNVPMGRVG